MDTCCTLRREVGWQPFFATHITSFISMMTMMIIKIMIIDDDENEVVDKSREGGSIGDGCAIAKNCS